MNNKQYIKSINTIIESVIIDLMNKEQIKTATFLRLRINNYIDIFNKHIQIEDASKGYMLDILQDLIIDKLEDIKRTEEVKELKEIMEDYFLTTMKEDEKISLYTIKNLEDEKIGFIAETQRLEDMMYTLKTDLIYSVNNHYFNVIGYENIKDIIKQMEKIAERTKELNMEINKISDQLNEYTETN